MEILSEQFSLENVVCVGGKDFHGVDEGQRTDDNPAKSRDRNHLEIFINGAFISCYQTGGWVRLFCQHAE